MIHIIKKFVIFSAVSALAMPALGALETLAGKEVQAFAKSSKKSSTKRSRSSRSSSKRKASRSSRTRRAPRRTTSRAPRRTTSRAPRRTTNRRSFTTTNRRTVRRGPTTRRTIRNKRRLTTRRRVTHHHRQPHTSRHTTVTTRRRVIRNRPVQRRVYRHRTHHRHHAPPRHTVTRTEVHHHHHSGPAPRVTNRRTVTTHTHTQTRVRHHRRATRRNVVNRRYYGSGNTSGGSVARGTYRKSNRSSATLNPTEVYLTANAGLGGFASNQLVTDALPGVGANLGFGVKRGWLAGELGFNAGGYRLDPQSNQSDMTLLGVSADIKLQPSFFFLEPFVLVGVGGQYFSDHGINSTATGGSLRLGGGLDFRVSQFALSAQYLYSQHGLFGDMDSRYKGEMISAQSDMLSLGVKVYF